MPILTLRLVAAIMGTAAIAWAADPVVGTWKLNVSKSKFSPGPAPKESTRVYEARPEGIKVTVKTVQADGSAFTILITENYDGKDYPVVGSPDYDTVELKKVNEQVAEATLMHGHILVAHAKREISADGKTMTITYRESPDRNHPVDNLAVYDRQ